MNHREAFGNAVWIGTGKADVFPVFRRSFTLRTAPQSARLRILGFGSFDCFLGGVRITEDRFLPLNTDFEARDFPAGEETAHRAYFSEFDVTHLLTAGRNALCVLLGNGWYNGNYSDKPFGARKLCYALTVEYGDGTVEEILSSEADKFAPSYLTRSVPTGRESHDYGAWRDDMLSPDFDDSAWASACPAEPVETELLRSDCPPDRVMERLTPTLVSESDGCTVWDAGKNVSGVPVLEATGGGDIRVTFGEELRPDGTLDPKHIYGQEFVATNVSAGQEIAPRFTWFGFRYVKIEGAARPITVDVIHADVAITSSFTSDDETLNWIFDTYLNTQLCNMHQGVPSDCPQIERRGYTGDGQITCRSAMKALDAKKFYEKWIADIADCQDRLSGHVQYTAPYTHSGGGPGGWGSAIVILPYEFMKHYGDDRPARAMYPQMLRYFDYLEAHSEGGFITSDRAGEWCLGDWCTPDPILLPPPFVNNYFYIRAMEMVIEMARLFGHEEDIPVLEARIKVRTDAIRAAYYDTKRATFFSGYQGADAFGLDLGLGDDKTAAGFLARYDALGYYDTGIFGTDVVTRLLFERGRGDIALRLLTAHEPHGFGAWMRDGATTFREYWGTSRSHSHPMFGSVVCYLFEYILGIRQTPDSYGYRKILIAPAGVVNAEGHLTAPTGKIAVSYRKEGDRETLTVSLPQGTEAELRLPGGPTATLIGPAEYTLRG